MEKDIEESDKSWREKEEEKKKIGRRIIGSSHHDRRVKYKEGEWRPWSPKPIKDPAVEFMGLETTFI